MIFTWFLALSLRIWLFFHLSWHKWWLKNRQTLQKELIFSKTLLKVPRNQLPATNDLLKAIYGSKTYFFVNFTWFLALFLLIWTSMKQILARKSPINPKNWIFLENFKNTSYGHLKPFCGAKTSVPLPPGTPSPCRYPPLKNWGLKT